ncbi:hypothetical protein BU23DRAFT_566126 [Bimuria novae-zelandiae CBS 107.79]|uniref:Uncharacterized protein n=1 Tax=Bimuria novae-zelandiae CBS 107.79 TaxID=1447943 RepID=A0A6A5VEJ5_9PLEO|nr:hypothetical protein BU23DRAFT_566126 [Bimuria novae-zelandiae CBS 107.79]
MGKKPCKVSPDGWHEVCKRFIGEDPSPKDWDNFSLHLLGCLAIVSIFVTAACAWRIHVRRGRGGRERADQEWLAAKHVVVVRELPTNKGFNEVLNVNSPKDDSPKDDSYKDEKVLGIGSLKAGF